MKPIERTANVVNRFMSGVRFSRRKIVDEYEVSYRTASRYMDMLKYEFPDYTEEILDNNELVIRRPS